MKKLLLCFACFAVCGAVLSGCDKKDKTEAENYPLDGTVWENIQEYEGGMSETATIRFGKTTFEFEVAFVEPGESPDVEITSGTYACVLPEVVLKANGETINAMIEGDEMHWLEDGEKLIFKKK